MLSINDSMHVLNTLTCSNMPELSDLADIRAIHTHSQIIICNSVLLRDDKYVTYI